MLAGDGGLVDGEEVAGEEKGLNKLVLFVIVLILFHVGAFVSSAS